LVKEKETPLDVDFSSGDAPPAQIMVNGKNIRIDWSNQNGIQMMKMDTHPRKYSISSEVIFYQFDA
jgi:hypothetical protein